MTAPWLVIVRPAHDLVADEHAEHVDGRRTARPGHGGDGKDAPRREGVARLLALGDDDHRAGRDHLELLDAVEREVPDGHPERVLAIPPPVTVLRAVVVLHANMLGDDRPVAIADRVDSAPQLGLLLAVAGGGDARELLAPLDDAGEVRPA